MARRKERVFRTPRAFKGSEAEAFSEMLEAALPKALSVPERANALRRVILERDRAFTNWYYDSGIKFPENQEARARSEALLKRYYLGERVPDTTLYQRRPNFSDEAYQQLTGFVSSIPWDRPMPGLYSPNSPLSEQGREALGKLTEHYSRLALSSQFTNRIPGIESEDVPGTAMLSIMNSISNYREPKENALNTWYSNDALVSDFESKLKRDIQRTLSRENRAARNAEQNELSAGFMPEDSDYTSLKGNTPLQSSGVPAYLRNIANKPLTEVMPQFSKLSNLQRENLSAYAKSVGINSENLTFADAYQMRQRIQAVPFREADDVTRPMLRGPKWGGLENQWRSFDRFVASAGSSSSAYGQNPEIIRGLQEELDGPDLNGPLSQVLGGNPADVSDYELEDESFTKLYPHLFPKKDLKLELSDSMKEQWAGLGAVYRSRFPSGKAPATAVSGAADLIVETNRMLVKSGAHYPDVVSFARKIEETAGLPENLLDEHLTVPSYIANDPENSITYLTISDYEDLYSDELDLLEGINDRGLSRSTQSEMWAASRRILEQQEPNRDAPIQEPRMVGSLESLMSMPREERAKRYKSFKESIKRREAVWQHPGNLDVAVGSGGKTIEQWPETYSPSEDFLPPQKRVFRQYQRGELSQAINAELNDLGRAYEASLDTASGIESVGPAARREFARRRGVRVDALEAIQNSPGGLPVLSEEQVEGLMNEGPLPKRPVFEPDEEVPPSVSGTVERRAGRPASWDDTALPEDLINELSGGAKRQSGSVEAKRPVVREPRGVKDSAGSLRKRRTWYADENKSRGAREEPPPRLDYDDINNRLVPPEDFEYDIEPPTDFLTAQANLSAQEPEAPVPPQANAAEEQSSKPARLPEAAREKGGQRFESAPNFPEGGTRQPNYTSYLDEHGRTTWRVRSQSNPRMWVPIDEKDVPPEIRDPEHPLYDRYGARRIAHDSDLSQIPVMGGEAPKMHKVSSGFIPDQNSGFEYQYTLSESIAGETRWTYRPIGSSGEGNEVGPNFVPPHILEQANRRVREGKETLRYYLEGPKWERQPQGGGVVDPETGEVFRDDRALRNSFVSQVSFAAHNRIADEKLTGFAAVQARRTLGAESIEGIIQLNDPKEWNVPPAGGRLSTRNVERGYSIAADAVRGAIESGSPNVQSEDWLTELVVKAKRAISNRITEDTKALDRRHAGPADYETLKNIDKLANKVLENIFGDLIKVVDPSSRATVGGLNANAWNNAVRMDPRYQGHAIDELYETNEYARRQIDLRDGLDKVKREGAYIPPNPEDPDSAGWLIQGDEDGGGRGGAGFGSGGRNNPYAAIRGWYAMRALKGVFDLTFAQGSQDMAQAVDFTNAISVAMGMGQSQIGAWANQTANRQIASGIAAYQNFGFAYDINNQIFGDLGAARLSSGLKLAGGIGVSGAMMSAISAMAGMGAIPGLGWVTAGAGLLMGGAYVGNEIYNAVTGQNKGLGERIGGLLGMPSSIPDAETRAYQEQLEIANAMGWDAGEAASTGMQATRLYGANAGGWTPDLSQVDITGTPGYQRIVKDYRTKYQREPGIVQAAKLFIDFERWGIGKFLGREPSESLFYDDSDFEPAGLDTVVDGQSIYSLQNVVQGYGVQTGLGDSSLKFLADTAQQLYPIDYRKQRNLVYESALRLDYNRDLETSYWAQSTKEIRDRLASSMFDQEGANRFVESLFPVGETSLQKLYSADIASRYVGSAAAYGFGFEGQGLSVFEDLTSGRITPQQATLNQQLFEQQLAMGAPAWLAFGSIDRSLPVNQQQALATGIQRQYELTGQYRPIADPRRYLGMSPGARQDWHGLQAQAQLYGADIWDIQGAQDEFDTLIGYQRENLPVLYTAFRRNGGTPEETALQAIEAVFGLTPEQAAGQEAIASGLYGADQKINVADLRRWTEQLNLPQSQRLSEAILAAETAGFSGTGITDLLAQVSGRTSGIGLGGFTGLLELYGGMGLTTGQSYAYQAGLAGPETASAVRTITQWQRGIGFSAAESQLGGFTAGMQFSDPLEAARYVEMGDLAFAATDNRDAALRFAEAAPGMDLMTRRYYSGIMRGDQWQLSRMARENPSLGLTPYFTETGYDTFFERSLALEDQSWALNTQSRQFQLGLGQEQYAQQRAMTFGGSFFNPVTGQTQTLQYGRLDIQDALFNLSERQQRYNLDYQQRQLDSSNRYQAEQMQRNLEQTQTRFDWRIEDWNYGENVSQLQFGWSMEDFDENIRFARGRERRLLMRQRDRAVIQESMRRGHSEDQRERIDVEREWALEAHELQRRYFEENKSLQQERLERERQYFEERLMWQNREREMSRLTAELEDNRQRRNLEHQNWMFAQEQQLHNEQRQMKVDQAEMIAEWRYFMETQMPGWLSSLANNLPAPSSNYSGGGSSGGGSSSGGSSGGGSAGGNNGSVSTPGVSTAPLPYGDWLLTSGGWVRIDEYSPQYSAGMDVGRWYNWKREGSPWFKEGGYTGDGAPSEPAGIVHKREWVVPEKGALVVRGDNPESIEILSQIRDAVAGGWTGVKEHELRYDTSSLSSPELVSVLKQIHSTLLQIANKGIANLTFNYGGNDFNRQMDYARNLLDKTYQ